VQRELRREAVVAREVGAATCEEQRIDADECGFERAFVAEVTCAEFDPVAESRSGFVEVSSEDAWTLAACEQTLDDSRSDVAGGSRD
jgi:hypothetical protein